MSKVFNKVITRAQAKLTRARAVEVDADREFNSADADLKSAKTRLIVARRRLKSARTLTTNLTDKIQLKRPPECVQLPTECWFVILGYVPDFDYRRMWKIGAFFKYCAWLHKLQTVVSWEIRQCTNRYYVPVSRPEYRWWKTGATTCARNPSCTVPNRICFRVDRPVRVRWIPQGENIVAKYGPYSSDFEVWFTTPRSYS